VNWSSFLVAMVKPIIVQILVSLGMSVVTFAGATTVVTQLSDYVQSNLSGLPVSVAQLLGLAGLAQALGILVGAFVFRLSMSSFKRLTFKTS
jgi:hypothetical protein